MVSALAYGVAPTLTITGSPVAPILNIGIPAGMPGAPGAAGTAGTAGVTPVFTIGNVTALAAGATPTVTITGTAAAPVLNLGIPGGSGGSTAAATASAAGTVLLPSGQTSNVLSKVAITGKSSDLLTDTTKNGSVKLYQASTGSGAGTDVDDACTAGVGQLDVQGGVLAACDKSLALDPIVTAKGTPANGQVPTWNASVQAYVPGTPAAASSAISDIRWKAAAVCNGGTAAPAALAVFDNNAPPAGCASSANSSGAYLAFAAAAASPQYASEVLALPSNFTGADLSLVFSSTVTTGNVTWSVATGCLNAGGLFSAVTYGTAQSVTTAVNATAGGIVTTAAIANIAVSGTNGCAAGSLMAYEISRSASDTAAAPALLIGANLTMRRSQ